MLVFKILNYLVVYNKDINNDAQRFLNANNRVPALIHFINDDTSKKMIYIHNHYRFASMPLDYISELFYNEKEYKDRGCYPMDRIFEKKQLDHYFIEGASGSTTIGVWLSWEKDWIEFGELNYSAKNESSIVPTCYNYDSFIVAHNDYITKCMSVYYDEMYEKYLDFLNKNRKEILNDNKILEEMNQLLFDEFGKILWRYSKLIPIKVDKAIVIDLNKLSEISIEEYRRSSGNDIRNKIILGHITPKAPEKSYEDLRREYFEKESLKLLKETKPKRRRKTSDKESNNKTIGRKRGVAKSVNNSTQPS